MRIEIPRDTRPRSRVVPGVPAPALAARMGQDTLREHGGVAYRSLETRSLVNRCSSDRLPFEWTVNPYRGCAIGCRYCYAAYTHEFMGLAAPEAFHSLVYVKRGGEQETARRLLAVARRGEAVALGTATDPYQPAEAREQVTRRFLQTAAGLRGLRLSLTTKGALVLRDLELLRRIHARSRLSIHVSLISPRAELLREVEPWAPPPAVRLLILERLVEAGLDAGLSVAPVLPALTDAEADLDELLGRAASAGVRRVWWNILFLRSPTREKYLRWLAAAFPRYLEAYERAYGPRVYLRGGYRVRIEETLRRLARKHGLRASGEGEEAPDRGCALRRERQLRLWA